MDMQRPIGLIRWPQLQVPGLVAAALFVGTLIWCGAADAATPPRLHLAPERGIANRYMVVLDRAAVQQDAMLGVGDRSRSWRLFWAGAIMVGSRDCGSMR